MVDAIMSSLYVSMYSLKTEPFKYIGFSRRFQMHYLQQQELCRLIKVWMIHLLCVIYVNSVLVIAWQIALNRQQTIG